MICTSEKKKSSFTFVKPQDAIICFLFLVPRQKLCLGGDFPLYPLYYIYELAGSPQGPVKALSLEERLTRLLLRAFLSPSRQQQEEIHRIILEAF